MSEITERYQESKDINSADKLEHACKKFGIKREWIGDSNVHTWTISHEYKGILSGTSTSTKCVDFTIVAYEDGDSDNDDNGDNESDEITFYGLYNRTVHSQASWSWSDSKGFILHDKICQGECNCLNADTCVDVLKDINDKISNLNPEQVAILESVYQDSIENDNNRNISEYNVEFDEIIEHPDFALGVSELGIDSAWIRDGKPHSWIQSSMVDGKQFVFQHIDWTIEVDIFICDGKKCLCFYGSFTPREKPEDIGKQSNPMGSCFQVGVKYDWEWSAIDGLEFFTEDDD